MFLVENIVDFWAKYSNIVSIVSRQPKLFFKLKLILLVLFVESILVIKRSFDSILQRNI